MGQPPGAPPEKWERRNPDDTVRRLVAGFQRELKGISEDVSSLKLVAHDVEALKRHSITHRELFVWAGILLGATAGLVKYVGSDIKEFVSSEMRANSKQTDLKLEVQRVTQQLETREVYKALPPKGKLRSDVLETPPPPVDAGVVEGK